jgi:hypothetical protein
MDIILFPYALLLKFLTVKIHIFYSIDSNRSINSLSKNSIIDVVPQILQLLLVGNNI